MATCLDVLWVDDEKDRGNATYNVVMPHFDGGDLFDVMFSPPHNNPSRMTEAEARPLINDVMEGLKAIHRAGICHHDLSPENILIHEGRAFIIDFGMAIRVPYTKDGRRCLISPQGSFGKARYMAPEVFANRLAFDAETIDVWSAGTILFCMLTGVNSYTEPHATDVIYRHMVNQLPLLLNLLDVELSRECVHLLRNMLRVNSRLRYSIDEVLKHPWMKGG